METRIYGIDSWNFFNPRFSYVKDVDTITMKITLFNNPALAPENRLQWRFHTKERYEKHYIDHSKMTTRDALSIIRSWRAEDV